MSGPADIRLQPARSLVVERISRRSPTPTTAPLPEPALAALAAIARDMRDVPRDCILDRAELFHWLRRMAGRVEGVSKIRVQAARPSGPPRVPATGGAGPRGRDGASGAQKTGPARTSRDLAEAVFGKPSSHLTVGKSDSAFASRTITSRKGRTVRVEFRRARAAGQLEMGV